MGIKVGVIDDMSIVREAIERSLPVFLEECEVLTSLSDGLEKILSEVDIFLVDYKMYIPGPEVVGTIKSIRPDAVVVGWSTALDGEKKKEFEEAGADMVISKDVTMEQLAALIESLL